MNPMKIIQIEKVTLNVGAGKEQTKLEKGLRLLQHITNRTPVKTVTQKRIPTWGVRPGLAIGCKVTIRKKELIYDLITRLLRAKNNELKYTQIDKDGNIAFGTHEYIDVPNITYDPEVGIMGFETCITLKRPGFRIKRRKNRKQKIGKAHRITREDAIEFMKKEFNVNIIEEEKK